MAKAVLILPWRIVRSVSGREGVPSEVFGGASTDVTPSCVQMPQATEITRKSDPADHNTFSPQDPKCECAKSFEKATVNAINPVASVMRSLVVS